MCLDRPLLFASQYGRINCIDELIKQGADLTVQDDNGQSVLHKAGYLAVQRRMQEVYAHLLKRGADPTLLNQKEKLPHEMCANDEVRQTLQQMEKDSGAC